MSVPSNSVTSVQSMSVTPTHSAPTSPLHSRQSSAVDVNVSSDSLALRGGGLVDAKNTQRVVYTQCIALVQNGFDHTPESGPSPSHTETDSGDGPHGHDSEHGHYGHSRRFSRNRRSVSSI